MGYFCGIVAYGEEVAPIPVLKIEESAFSVALQILAFEVVHPVKPFAVELQLFPLEDLSLVLHAAFHHSLDLVDDEIRLEFALVLFFAKGHEFADESVCEESVLGELHFFQLFPKLLAALPHLVSDILFELFFS